MKPYSRLSLLSFPILIIFCVFAACSKNNPGEAQINDVKVSGGWSGTADQFDQKFVQHGGRLNTMTGYTGTLTILDDEARKVSQETFKQGLREGASLRWYNNGNKQMESNYVDGKRSGPTYEWYLDAKKRSEKEYSAGTAHGKEVAWYDDGAKHYERNFAGGKPVGIWTDWDRAGNIVRQVEYKDGRALRQIVP